MLDYREFLADLEFRRSELSAKAVAARRRELDLAIAAIRRFLKTDEKHSLVSVPDSAPETSVAVAAPLPKGSSAKDRPQTADATGIEIDYAEWLTREEAARRIGVSGKTVAKLEHDQKLRRKNRSRPGLPPVAIYHPDDVRSAAERYAIVRTVVPPHRINQLVPGPTALRRGAQV